MRPSPMTKSLSPHIAEPLSIEQAHCHSNIPLLPCHQFSLAYFITYESWYSLITPLTRGYSCCLDYSAIVLTRSQKCRPSLYPVTLRISKTPCRTFLSSLLVFQNQQHRSLSPAYPACFDDLPILSNDQSAGPPYCEGDCRSPQRYPLRCQRWRPWKRGGLDALEGFVQRPVRYILRRRHVQDRHQDTKRISLPAANNEIREQSLASQHQQSDCRLPALSDIPFPKCY